MYEHILVPVAFDEGHSADPALSVAKALADGGSKVTLLHVVEEIPTYAINYMPDAYRAGLLEAIQADLDKMAGGIAGAKGVVVSGHSGRTILDWADDNGVDLIVMPSHKPGLADYFLGSTASRVVRHATCSVHVIR